MRYRNLDGLRGAAAVAVLIHHSLLTVVVLEPAILSHYSGLTPIEWLFTYTPLHILWAGTEAVYLFFVLSGLVLTLPFAARGQMDWRRYFPQRIARLYLPAWGGLALATVLAVLVPRDGSSGTAWLAVHHPLELASLPRTASLLLGDPTGLDTPLWSLQWEVLFSLTLPLYFFAARWMRGSRRLIGSLVLCVVAVLAGFATHVALLEYMPMFGMGVALAMNMDVLASLGARIAARRNSPVLWAGLSVVAAILVCGRWIGQGSPVASGLLQQAGMLVSVPGVVLVVVLALESPAFRWFLERPALQWCGKVSFSLYLVHEPIVVSVALLAPEAGYGILAITIPLSLLAAWAFYAAVERPAHLFSRWIGASMVRSRTAAVEAEPGLQATGPATSGQQLAI